jgi:hypothetical protein
MSEFHSEAENVLYLVITFLPRMFLGYVICCTCFPLRRRAAEAPLDPKNGEVTIRHRHYRQKCTIQNGVLRAKQIDEKYNLSSAFPNCLLHLTTEQPKNYDDFAHPLVQERDVGVFVDLVVGQEYFGMLNFFFCKSSLEWNFTHEY